MQQKMRKFVCERKSFSDVRIAAVDADQVSLWTGTIVRSLDAAGKRGVVIEDGIVINRNPEITCDGQKVNW
jgi:hypothetical protein